MTQWMAGVVADPSRDVPRSFSVVTKLLQMQRRGWLPLSWLPRKERQRTAWGRERFNYVTVTSELRCFALVVVDEGPR